jgi:hypothetical protein
MLSVYVVTGGVVLVLLPLLQDVNNRLDPIPSQAARFHRRFLMPILPFHLRVLPSDTRGRPDRIIHPSRMLWSGVNAMGMGEADTHRL